MIIYEDANTEIYLEHGEFYIKKFFPYHIYELTYKELIEEIYSIPDRSEAWKRLTVIQAGKAAEILSEVA
ncbi:MAG: hypothetical protein J6Q32_05165 [Clostridia bacterium]|nr:hypothetical protein [Clostridia bacterium]